MTEQEQADALKAVISVIARCQRAQPKFAPGTSQYTLLKNRIQAMKIAQALLVGSGAELYSTQDLSAALEPLTSIIRKCKKARSKYEPGSGQYNRYGGTIQAIELSRELIKNELHRRSL
jgi:two-component sensor histidine kinase